MNGNEALRKALDELLEKNPSGYWYKPDLFETHTRAKIPPELEIVEPPPAEDRNFNCYIFALGLHYDPRFLGHENWEFMRWLGKRFDAMIQEGTLTPLSAPENSCLVVYRNDDDLITHVGLMQDQNTVLSKWSWGPLIQHRLYDVPAMYGDTVEFYTGLSEAKTHVSVLRDSGWVHKPAMHAMRLREEPFRKIKAGTKTIEIRLNDEKRQALEVGDCIEFSLDTDPEQKLKTTVVGLRRFATFKDLFAAYPPEKYGGKDQGEYQLMYQYYSPEDERKHGVLAIKLELLHA